MTLQEDLDQFLNQHAQLSTTIQKVAVEQQQRLDDLRRLEGAIGYVRARIAGDANDAAKVAEGTPDEGLTPA